MHLSRRAALSAITAFAGGSLLGLPAFAKATLANAQAVGLNRIKIG